MDLSSVYKIDISQPLYPTPIQQMLICQDKNANRLTFELYDGDNPFSPGGSCAGYAVRSDGQTVPMTGPVSANVLSIVLPEETYAIEGPLNIVVKSVAGNARTSVFFGMGTVLIGQTGTIVNPGDVIPDITELMAAIDQMEQATAAAEAAATKSVRYDTAQSLTDAQKLQARQNIGVGTGLVSYDEAQTLTDAQKTQARINISAAQAAPTGDGMGDHDGLLIIY